MASPPSLSPAAQSRQKHVTLIIGILLVALWVVPVVLLALDPSENARGLALAGLLYLVPGAIMTWVGARAELRARRFNRLDRAFAEGLADELQALCAANPLEAYRTAQDLVEVRDARLVEVERHFDQRAVGTVAGRLSHQLSLFTGSLDLTYGRPGVGGMTRVVHGMAGVRLVAEQRTWDNLMGDAVFVVLEAPGPAGPDDTYRVVSVSAAAAAGWVQALVFATVDHLEGPRTFAGSTLADFSGRVVSHFAPQDVSYAADRLRAQAGRAPERRDVLTVRGLGIGRNALLGVDVQIGREGALLLFPVQFPALFGQAVARAARRADAVVSRPGTPELR